MTMTPARSVRGEQLEVSERVILAPAVGVFQPAATEWTPMSSPASGGGEADQEVPTEGTGEVTAAATMVAEGDVVGVVEVRGEALPVRSAFTGFLMGMLAHPGERVREGQPVAWLRVV